MAKRRANGEGTIYKRKDGRWEGRITVGYKEDGKAIYKNCLAKTQKLIVENVAKSCELPKAYRAEMRTLSTQDLTNFFEEAKKSGVFEMYYIEIVTGLRRGELLGVKWTDIDYKKRIISVKRQVLRINGEIIEAPLKTKNSYRNIPIGADAVEILRQKQEKSNSQYVFSNPDRFIQFEEGFAPSSSPYKLILLPYSSSSTPYSISQ